MVEVGWEGEGKEVETGEAERVGMGREGGWEVVDLAGEAEVVVEQETD